MISPIWCATFSGSTDRILASQTHRSSQRPTSFSKASLGRATCASFENVVRKALLLAQGFTITPDHLRDVTRPAKPFSSRLRLQSLHDLTADLLGAAQRGETRRRSFAPARSR